RYLPMQDPKEILGQIGGLDDASVLKTFSRPPAIVERESRFVQALRDAASPHEEAQVMSVGRDGASDAVSFLRAGVPAVEFGPIGGGHHGPDEWVSIASLQSYGEALQRFLHAVPAVGEG